MEIMKECIGIIGAGIMGNELALTLSACGYYVTIIDINNQKLDASYDYIQKNLLIYQMQKQIDKSTNVMQNITFTLDFDKLEKCLIIFECIAENIPAKLDVLSTAESICSQNCILSSNTSCIPIDKLAEGLINKDRLMGTHFFNPVFKMRFVELIKGKDTDMNMIKKMELFLDSIRISSIQISDGPGFISNRLSHVFINEAAMLVNEGKYSCSQIDTVFKKGYGHTMGPLETADIIGVDVVVDSLDVLYNELKDEKYRCCSLLRNMKENELFGRKSGKGFYNYFKQEG